MLQRGGVEHQLGADLLEQAADARLVAHIGQHGAARHLGVLLAQFEVDLVEHVFAVIEQRQAGRAEGRDLPRQFAADGAAGAGDQHAPALHQPRHALAVERHLRAVEQILDRDRAQFDAPAFAAAGRGQGGRRRGAADRHAVAVGGVQQRFEHRRRTGRRRAR